MNPLDSAHFARSATAAAHAERWAAARTRPAAARVADDGFDVESWLGYESIHPLTWVPVHGAAESHLLSG